MGRVNGKSKGNAFERSICRKLSLWWSKGQSDDVFWRTSNSGGRATVRGKTGRRTSGQYGDICAIDPDGVFFLEVFTVELKRGYSNSSLADLLDGKSEYTKWIKQIRQSSTQAGSLSWMLIVKRNRRDEVVIMPMDMADGLRLSHHTMHVLSFWKDDLKLTAVPLSHFLEGVESETVLQIAYERRSNVNAG